MEESNPVNTSNIFLTDEEFKELFGKEVSRITRVLNKAAESKCSACKGNCCKEIGCALYSEAFSYCPIYEIRPRECRYHFCMSVMNEAPLTQEDKELLNKPINDLFRGNKEQISRLFTLFPQFPLDSEGLASLGIKEEVNRMIKAFEDGELDENQAADLLKSLCLNAARRKDAWLDVQSD